MFGKMPSIFRSDFVNRKVLQPVDELFAMWFGN